MTDRPEIRPPMATPMPGNPQSVEARPTVSGSLSQTPMAQVLMTIYRQSMSGTLVLWPADLHHAEDRVVFRGGAPVAANFSGEVDRFVDGLLGLFDRKGDYSFYQDANLAEDPTRATGPVDPMQLVATGVHERPMPDVVERAVSRLGHRSPLRLKEMADLDRLELSPSDRECIDTIRRGGATAGSLLSASPDPSRTGRLIYLLLAIGELSRSPRANRRAHTERPRRDPMEGSGEHRTVAASELLAPELASRRPPGQRRPISAMERGRRMLDASDWPGALRVFDEACRIDPERAEYHAHRAWCLYRMHSGRGPHERVMLQAINRAVQLDPELAQAHYYRGHILKRLGFDDKARVCFRRALSLEAHHPGARQALGLGDNLLNQVKSKLFGRA